VYETVNDPVSREVCGYLLVRGGVHAHAYGIALKQLTGVDMTKMLPVPNIPTEKFPEARRYMEQGSHRRLYRFSPNDYAEISAIWGNGEQALPGDPAGKLEVIDGAPDGGKIPDLAGISGAFTPDYQPEEIFEIASKPYKASKG
jgi:Mn-containing catalase